MIFQVQDRRNPWKKDDFSRHRVQEGYLLVDTRLWRTLWKCSLRLATRMQALPLG